MGLSQEDKDLILRVQKAEFFSSLSEEEIADFYARCRKNKYPPQTYISEAGSMPNYIGILESGDIQIYVNIKDKRIKIGQLEPGELFLVMPYFYNTKTAIDIMTLKGCFVIEIPNTKMDLILQKHPEKYDIFRKVVDKKNKQSAAAVKKFILSQPSLTDKNEDGKEDDMSSLLKINI